MGLLKHCVVVRVRTTCSVPELYDNTCLSAVGTSWFLVMYVH